MLTLAISSLTTSNLRWFMDLTFQVPMQYCSLQHQNFFPSPVTYTTGCCFCFGFISSFFLELFLHWSPVAHWAPTDLGHLSFSVLSFCLFIWFMGFSRQEYWSGLPFHSPVDHVLLELSTITHISWVSLQGMAHSFLELDKAVVHVISLSSLALSKSNLRKFLDRWTYFCVLYLVGVSDFFFCGMKSKYCKQGQRSKWIMWIGNRSSAILESLQVIILLCR